MPSANAASATSMARVREASTSASRQPRRPAPRGCRVARRIAETGYTGSSRRVGVLPAACRSRLSGHLLASHSLRPLTPLVRRSPDDDLRVGAATAVSRLPPPEARLYDVAADARVLAHCYWQPRPEIAPDAARPPRPRGLEQRPLHARPRRQGIRPGWNAVLLNQRNCGGTEHLSRTLYHSGLTADPRFVLESLLGGDGCPRSRSRATRSAAI